MLFNDCRGEKWGIANRWSVGDMQFTSPNLGFHHKSAADSSVDEHLKNTAVLCHCLVGNGVCLCLGSNSPYHLNNLII